MGALRLYSVSDNYIQYLRSIETHVYDPKLKIAKHGRKYVGIALEINGYNYYVPLSSPKDNDYIVINGRKHIRQSVTPIVRIVVCNSKGKLELKGTLRISHMIPVPASELKLYDVDNELDLAYKALVQQELIFIRKNKNLIKNNAWTLYKEKATGTSDNGYLNSTLDYRKLEIACDNYMATISSQESQAVS